MLSLTGLQYLFLKSNFKNLIIFCYPEIYRVTFRGKRLFQQRMDVYLILSLYNILIIKDLDINDNKRVSQLYT